MAEEVRATHIAAWLRPLPEGYTIPVWRWILIPASAWMLKRSGGVWVNGEMRLFHNRIRFTQVKTKFSRTAPIDWEMPLESITDVTVRKGVVSETIELRHPDGLLKFMTARSADFVAQLERAIDSRSAP